MANPHSSVFDRDQDQILVGMASLNSNVFGRSQELAWLASTGESLAGTKIPLAMPPALTRESLAGAKNIQTVAGMASPHSSVFFMQGPGSGPSWHGQSQQQHV